VQAQYFRDPARMPLYLTMNPFLPAVNGEECDICEESRRT
jgi:hypothetical protein